MPVKQAVLGWLVALLTLSALASAVSAAQTGTTYTVQAGDSLGSIAATYGTTVDAIMQANGLASADMVWAGETLIVPALSAVAPAGSSDGSGNSYVVQVGDTLASIAGQLGISATALAQANGVTNPDLLWIGQRLLIPGTTLGSAASAAPAQPAATADGYYTVQPGDTLNSIARQLGTTATALADANSLSNADLLLLGQRLALPGTAAAAPTAVPGDAANPGPAAAGSDQYVVQPGDTLNSIAQALNVSADALAQANGLANADMLAVGQTLVVPGAASATAPAAGADATSTPTGQTTGAPTAGPTATPAGQITAAPTAGPVSGSGHYVVQPGDTFNSIAQTLGVSAAALAAANNIANTDMLAVGQELVIPDSSATAIATAVPTVPAPAAQAQAGPAQIRYTVQRGDTLGTIAKQYNMSAAAIARANHISSPDLVSLGMTLIIPSPAWTAPDFSGTPSRFVVSITQQRCWLYQGNRVVADWPCSTGQAGTDTHPGSYKIQSKMDRAFGSTWNIWMPYWLGIYWAGASENGIHGIPYGATNSSWRLWEGYVGTPVTYGCVLLDDAHAKQLYDVAYIGMPVIIQP